MVASSLNNLNNTFNYKSIDIFYDESNGGVDFIIQKKFQKPVPIEIGLGKKKDKQVKKFMDKHESPYGIIISNKTSKIEKNDDIMYIPPKTFSYM